jgi:hypothetical protein
MYFSGKRGDAATQRPLGGSPQFDEAFGENAPADGDAPDYQAVRT